MAKDFRDMTVEQQKQVLLKSKPAYMAWLDGEWSGLVDCFFDCEPEDRAETVKFVLALDLEGLIEATPVVQKMIIRLARMAIDQIVFNMGERFLIEQGELGHEK